MGGCEQVPQWIVGLGNPADRLCPERVATDVLAFGEQEDRVVHVQKLRGLHLPDADEKSGRLERARPRKVRKFLYEGLHGRIVGQREEAIHAECGDELARLDRIAPSDRDHRVVPTTPERVGH
jgi:hypothetical protein